ncbi:MAG: hypothetical protein AAF358_07535 [Pseudomonadota bacterium]
MSNSAPRWHEKRHYPFNPRAIGLTLAIAASLWLFWIAEHEGVEHVLGAAGIILLGCHLFLAPAYYGAELDKLEREEHLDRHQFIKLMAAFLLALWVVAEFIV